MGPLRRAAVTALALCAVPACTSAPRPTPDAALSDAALSVDGASADAADAARSRDVPDGAPPPVTDPPGPPRFNRAFRIATHNSYWVARDATAELFASGTQHRLLDQLLFDHARAIELDVHRDRDAAGVFRVFHTDNEAHSLCSPLGECARMLRTFHYAVPDHEPVVVVVELKELTDDNFDATHTPADLDRAFTEVLGETRDGAFRSWLFTPADLLARCPAGATLRACARTAGWPTIAEMRGRFVLAVLGNLRIDYTQQICLASHPPEQCPVRAHDTVLGHGPAGWVAYANWGGGAAERAGFPMRSNWLEFNAGPDSETVPPEQLAVAEEASVLEQVEDLTDPWVPWHLADNVLVRGHDSFTLEDQAARVAAGFALVQTDYPWLQFDERGPDHPFRPLAPRPAGEDPGVFTEPGKRLYLRGPSDTARFGVAYAVDAPSPTACTRWQTAVSITRPSPAMQYPPVARPRGRGCLRAAADGASDASDAFTVCRTTVEGEYAQVTIEARVGGVLVQSAMALSPARTAGGAGELIRMDVCPAAGGSIVRAYTAGDVLAATGEPDWVPIGDAQTFASALAFQGLAAAGDVLFVGARRDDAYVSSYDLRAPRVPDAPGQPPLDDASLTDLSYPAPSAGCHDPLYPSGCRAPR